MVLAGDLTSNEIRWFLLKEGLVRTRVLKFDRLVAQMLEYTSSRHRNEFAILSRCLRESTTRANLAISESGMKESRRLDYAAMMAKLWSPEGWKICMPPLPWPEKIENCHKELETHLYAGGHVVRI